MKRTCYNVVIEFKDAFRGIFRRRFEGFKKIKYRMNGENLKIYLYLRNGSIETVEYTNVLSVKVTKYRA